MRNTVARGSLLAVCAGAVVLTPGAAVAGTTWNVSDFDDLRNAANNAASGDEIVIAKGDYLVTSALYVTTPNLTFRGATGDRDDVTLHGKGMNDDSGVFEGFYAAADGIQLRDLTIRDFWHHGIHICGDGYADDVVISNVKTINCGERHVKGSAYSGISNNVLIENLWMEQTEAYLPRLEHPIDDYNYIGGIDAMHTNGWTVRDCTAVNIRGATGGGRAAFFLWNGVSDLLLERNTIIRCGHGISIGNPHGPIGSHVDPWHAEGGTIRNNFILRRDESIDNWAMELDNTKDFKVYNNTIYSEDVTYFRTLQIYDEAGEGLTTNLDLQNNILRGRVHDVSTGDWSSAAVAAMGNLVDTSGATVLPSWFVDAAGGDFHLTELAAAAIDGGAVLADVPTDFDVHSRPYAAGVDFGADEWAIPGDADLDTDVDFDDFSTVAFNYGLPGAWTDGDFDRDGEVDFDDFSALSFNFGRVAGYGPTGQSVPEPATGLLLAAGVLLLARRRARRR
jgi:hypothetical protein